MRGLYNVTALHIRTVRTEKLDLIDVANEFVDRKEPDLLILIHCCVVVTGSALVVSSDLSSDSSHNFDLVS